MIIFSSLNIWLFLAVHSLVGWYKLVDYIGIFFADYVQYVIAGVFLVLFFRKINRQQNRTMVVIATSAALLARFIVKPLILLFVAEPRPFVYLHITPLISAAAGEEFQSFPSGHALFFFALAMAVFCFHKKYGIYFFVTAIIMGIARVYTGVHWPLDIVFGAVLGTGVGWLVYHLYLRNTLKVERWFLSRSDKIAERSGRT